MKELELINLAIKELEIARDIPSELSDKNFVSGHRVGLTYAIGVLKGCIEIHKIQEKNNGSC